MSSSHRAALALFLVVMLVYSVPLVYDMAHKPFFTWEPGIDVTSATLLPLVILQRGDFTLEQFQSFISNHYRDPFFVAQINGRLVSRYPITAAVLSIPFYESPIGTGWIFDSHLACCHIRRLPFRREICLRRDDCHATVMAFFCARRLTDQKTSAVLTLAFALGTSVWSTNSQGLWQQTRASCSSG